ncbi:ATP-binding protein [Streptomyces sp. NBC_01538]|uniref:ATP-binding protein n=1 Tax=Streptomyces sp. NBC_01538 TaxID=2903897 RepID=UPI00386AB1A3
MTTLIPVAGNLPAPLTSFVGRQREVAEIRRLLRTARLVTLTGTGGVGKTRLALRVGELSREAFPDGVWVVDLAPVRDPSMVAATTLGALRLPDHGTRSALELLTHHLARHRALIVLDNCEHLTDASASLATALLSACPGLRVLTTSRRTLRVVGENVHVLAPLAADGEAVELLQDRATAVRPGFSITDANRAQAVRLCTELDGLPLAIELAAARLRSFTLEVTMERLTDRFALLTGSSRTAPPRHHSLRGTVEWSYELCTAAERLLWNRLAVFRGGFGLDAAEEVCAGDGIAPAGVLDLLDRLVAQSVVSTCDRDGLTRYQLPEILREYGYARLSESDRRRLLRRHRDFFLTLAERLALRWYGPGQQEALGRLRAEHANLRMALEFSNGSPDNDGDSDAGVDLGADAQAGLALAAALRFHWCANGLLGEGRQQLDRALAAAPEPTLSRARALSAAAYLALLQADPATAQSRLDEVERLGHQLENPSVRAHAQGLRGTSALLADRPEQALAHFEEALAIHRGARETVEPLFWLFQIAIAQSRLADPRAADTGRRAVALAQAHGERHCRSYALLALGYELWARGDAEQALPHIQAALEILRDFNDFIATSRALELLAWIAASRGAHHRSALLLGAVSALARSVDIAPGAEYAEHHARCAEAVAAALGRAAYLKALADGSRHDSPAQAIHLALQREPAPADSAVSAGIVKPLSRREEEVSELVARGMTNRQIAAALNLSPRTVDRHVENILTKLGLCRRAQIAAWWTQSRVPAV